MNVLITAGGTFEPMDDVRGITNRSTGRLGASLANAFARRGDRVTVLASDALAKRSEWFHEEVQIASYLSFRDLREALQDARGGSPDLLLMAAAVADYSPIKVHGKLPSDAAKQQLVLHRNPKLLASLPSWFPHTKIVGFKLLSRATKDELARIATRQIEQHRLFACVANDMSELEEGWHPVTLFTAMGASRRIEGTKSETAEQIVKALADSLQTSQ